MLTRRTVFTGGLALGLAGCGSQTLDDYANETPKLDLREYLSGRLTATGIFFDYSGTASLRFDVDMVGTWDGNTGTLTEDFVYSDGRKEQRIWTLRFSDDRRFTASAPDTVGEGSGEQRGNSATMNYRLKIPRDGDEITVSMEDWFYLQADGTLINRATMRKFGLTVGEVLVVFRKGSA